MARPRLLFVVAVLVALLVPSASGALRGLAASGANLIKNPGFEKNRNRWGNPPMFKIVRSTRYARSGSASLHSIRTARSRRAIRRGSRPDGNTGFYWVKVPHAGKYRAQAWVYLPRNYDGGPPKVNLEWYREANVTALHLGNPKLRGRWQRVWTDYLISPDDTTGFIVLRMIVKLPSVGKFVFWDDVTMAARD